jgi:hypothetical protein
MSKLHQPFMTIPAKAGAVKLCINPLIYGNLFMTTAYQVHTCLDF